MQRKKIFELLPRQVWTLADALGIVGIVFISFYYLTAFRFPSLITQPSRQVDFGILYTFPWLIFHDAHYPSLAPFPYPPSAVVMLLPLHMLPQHIAFVVWLLAQAASLWIVVWSSIKLSGAANWPGRWALGCIGVLLTDNPLSWDLRNHNSNLVILAIVMLGFVSRRAWVSALLLAASAGLKVYSGLLIFLIAWWREWRLAGLTAASMCGIFILLPVLVFGPADFVQVLRDWLDQVRFTATLEGYYYGTHIITLRRAFATLLDSDPSSKAVIVLWRGSEMLWIALVIWYFATANKVNQFSGYGVAQFADICVTLLVPLPVSTWLEPYHAVVMLPAYILLLTVLFRDEWPSTARVLSAAALCGPIISRIAIQRLEIRGLAFLISFSLIVIALAAARRAVHFRPIESTEANHAPMSK